MHDRSSRNVRRWELTAPGISKQLTVIREIRRQQTVQRLENQQGVLEDDLFRDCEPMKLLEDQSDMVLALHASDKACSGILKCLRALKQAVGDAV